MNCPVVQGRDMDLFVQVTKDEPIVMSGANENELQKVIDESAFAEVWRRTVHHRLEMDYIVLQSKPVLSLLRRVHAADVHRGITAVAMAGLAWKEKAFILWYDLFTVTPPQNPCRLRRDMKL